METNTGNDQRELEALRFSSRASRAITTLEMQRKSIGREYGERIKKIKALILILQQRESLGQMSLDGMDAVDAIEGTQTGAGDRPVEPQVIERIELSE